MPQLLLPIFPEGSTHITAELTFEKRNGRVTYFHGLLPVFVHDEDDIKSFRMITAQFCVNGLAKQVQITKAFGVSRMSLLRAVKLLREKGVSGFFAPRKTRGAAVLTKPVLARAQDLLDEGRSVYQVADEIGVKRDTFRRAVAAGLLHAPPKKKLR